MASDNINKVAPPDNINTVAPPDKAIGLLTVSSSPSCIGLSTITVTTLLLSVFGNTAVGMSTSERRIPDEQRLYETIMDNYQLSVMPQINITTPLSVAFSLRLNQIVSLDERQQVLTTNVFIDQTWIDPGLSWDPDNFSDVRALRIPADHVWLPDTFVYNNADGGTSGFMRGTYVQIQSNGRVLWPVPLRLRSSCSVHITYFPFDSQVCTLQFGSWIYGMTQVDYTPLTNGLTVDPSTYINNSEWELVEISMNKAHTLTPTGGPGVMRRLGPDLVRRSGRKRKKAKVFDDPHSLLTYVLHLKRNTFFYMFNIIVPCVMLSTLNILTFWLPPVSGEKVTLGLSVFLAFSMFMLLIAEEVPATSEAVPLIGVYLCVVMTMTSLSVIMAVVVTNLYHRGRKMRAAPRWLVKVCLSCLAAPLCVNKEISLIASTVDLEEHCQYDMSYRRKSRCPADDKCHSQDTPPSTSLVAYSPSNGMPSSVPNHLQNGGQLARVTSLAVTSGKEVHPRVRNSVTNSVHFVTSDVKADRKCQAHDVRADRACQEVFDGEQVWIWRRQDHYHPLYGHSYGDHGDDKAESHFNNCHDDDSAADYLQCPLSVATKHSLAVDTKHSLSADTKHSLSVDTKHSLSVDTKHSLSVDTKHSLSVDTKHSLPGHTKHSLSVDTKHSLSVDTKHSLSHTCNMTTHPNTACRQESHLNTRSRKERSDTHPIVAGNQCSFDPRPIVAGNQGSLETHPKMVCGQGRLKSHLITAGTQGRLDPRPAVASTRGRLDPRPAVAGTQGRLDPRSTVAGSQGRLDPHPNTADIQSARILVAEWQQIATVVDRLMFVLYFVFTVTAYVVILAVVPANQPHVVYSTLDTAGDALAVLQWGT